MTRTCDHCDPRHPYGGMIRTLVDAANVPHHLCKVHRTALFISFSCHSEDMEIAEALVAEGLPASVLPSVPPPR